jgi:uncharacterized cupredoxin-like copper-binding protein
MIGFSKVIKANSEDVIIYKSTSLLSMDNAKTVIPEKLQNRFVIKNISWGDKKSFSCVKPGETIEITVVNLKKRSYKFNCSMILTGFND